ncbi:neuropeptides B/W receptor type 1-like [Ischnura elegans]|uniref:neuropeptides B/W receptor type 1-like n=1 Tax=Ischnura elegans TaxID=197161 RepID=UPI001ED88EAE|nr:neuropeptides B/W receptor type 1-like [Ischnura elegans]
MSAGGRLFAAMDHLSCPGCRLSASNGSTAPQESPPSPSTPSPPPLPPEALAFICASGVACLLSNAILAAALIRAHTGGPQKASRRRLLALLLNLALADLLSAALLGPLEALALSKEGAWDIGALPCRLFLGGDVLMCSGAAYALAALALHAAHAWAPGPFVGLSWMLSASLSVPAFALADVVLLPSASGLEPRPHCSLPLALGPAGGPLLLLRLPGAALGFALPTLVILVCNVQAVVAYVRRGHEAAEASDRDESLKLCFALSLSHVICSFPRFAYALLILTEQTDDFLVPPLTSGPAGGPPAFALAALHYAASALRPALVVAASAPLRRALLPRSRTSTSPPQR